MKPAKHYYDDDGRLQFDQNRDLLVKLAKAIGLETLQAAPGSDIRGRIAELAIEVQYQFDICKSLGGLGGGMDQWGYKTSVEDCPIKQVLKEILFDAVGRDFLHNEFLLIAWAAACEVQMYAMIGE